MNLLKITSLIFALFITLTTTNAQSENKDVTITASGSGKSIDEAKQAALRSATEQAFGAFISSKTEMFNDQVVADQMASVSSGNIKSFVVISQDQIPNGTWSITVKAVVSVDKLSSFVAAKGVEIDIKGGLFALNIKQQLLNENSEIKALSDMVGILHEAMQISFDYVIKTFEPKSIDSDSKNWEIPLIITATCNKNIDFCANYLIKILSALSLTSKDLETYRALKKNVYSLNVSYKGKKYLFYLRKKSSIDAIYSFTSNWEFYTRLFIVNSGIDLNYGKGISNKFEFAKYDFNEISEDEDEITSISILLPLLGQSVANFTFNDLRTLDQIERITKYTVKPRGIISNFKFGGYVVYEKDGHGLVLALYDLDKKLNLPNAIEKVKTLELNGYNDWTIPSLLDFEIIKDKIIKQKLGGFEFTDRKLNNGYWTIDGTKFYLRDYDSIHTQESDCVSCAIYNLRLIRKF